MNLLQLAVGVLHSSKTIFLSELMFLLEVLRVDCCSLTYLDTDSAILQLADRDFSKCIRPCQREAFEKYKSAIFEDPQSDRLQSGKLKLEGEFNGRGF